MYTHVQTHKTEPASAHKLNTATFVTVSGKSERCNVIHLCGTHSWPLDVSTRLCTLLNYCPLKDKQFVSPDGATTFDRLPKVLDFIAAVK